MDCDPKNPQESAVFVRIGSVSNVCFLMNYGCAESCLRDACLAAKCALKAGGLLHDTDKAIAAICCMRDTPEKNCFFMQRSKECTVTAKHSDIETAVRRLLQHKRPLGETCAAVIVDIRTPESALPFDITKLQPDGCKRDATHYWFTDSADGADDAYHIDNLDFILE
jgi:hypothetical protein